MVALVAGSGLGLERSSAFVLGSRGVVGQAGLGRASDNVYVNAATGNLVVQNADEMLIGLGPDSAIARTYNSQGDFTDDNGDRDAGAVRLDRRGGRLRHARLQRLDLELDGRKQPGRGDLRRQ